MPTPLGMERNLRQIRTDREAKLFELASAFQRRDLAAFEAAVRPDMILTLAGSSRLAGTYQGYAAFHRYLEVLRTCLRWSGRPITFDHDGDVMVFRQAMVVMSSKHDAEMTLVVTVRYDGEGRIESFVVEPDDQGLFDHVVDTAGEMSA